MLDALHDLPRFTQFDIMKVENLFYLIRKYKRVILILLAYDINARAVCINSYRSPSIIGTSIVAFTLKQNNFMVKHIL